MVMLRLTANEIITIGAKVSDFRFAFVDGNQSIIIIVQLHIPDQILFSIHLVIIIFLSRDKSVNVHISLNSNGLL